MREQWGAALAVARASDFILTARGSRKQSDLIYIKSLKEHNKPQCLWRVWILTQADPEKRYLRQPRDLNADWVSDIK